MDEVLRWWTWSCKVDSCTWWPQRSFPSLFVQWFLSGTCTCPFPGHRTQNCAFPVPVCLFLLVPLQLKWLSLGELSRGVHSEQGQPPVQVPHFGEFRQVTECGLEAGESWGGESSAKSSAGGGDQELEGVGKHRGVILFWKPSYCIYRRCSQSHNTWVCFGVFSNIRSGRQPN